MSSSTVAFAVASASKCDFRSADAADGRGIASALGVPLLGEGRYDHFSSSSPCPFRYTPPRNAAPSSSIFLGGGSFVGNFALVCFLPAGFLLSEGSGEAGLEVSGVAVFEPAGAGARVGAGAGKRCDV